MDSDVIREIIFFRKVDFEKISRQHRSIGFQPHLRHCVVSLSKNINPSLVVVKPRKTHNFITERLLMGRKELNQTNKTKKHRKFLSMQRVVRIFRVNILERYCRFKDA